jgi:hypothetical protein
MTKIDTSKKKIELFLQKYKAWKNPILSLSLKLYMFGL